MPGAADMPYLMRVKTGHGAPVSAAWPEDALRRIGAAGTG